VDVRVNPVYNAIGWISEQMLRNDKNIISSISVTDIVFDDYLRK